jgi:hypothetical protein
MLVKLPATGCLPKTANILPAPCDLHRVPAGIDAVGGRDVGNKSFDFNCPQGSHIIRYRGYVGPPPVDWIYGLGPVECSDGSNSSALWGNTTSKNGNQGVPFDQGPFGAGCRGLDVVYDEASINRLNFSNCGGGLVGGATMFVNVPQNSSLRCPTGMQVVGVYGAFEPEIMGLVKLGLYCI